MKKEIFWKPEHQQLIEQYYWCYTATTSAETRNYLYGKLYSTFNEIIDRAVVTTNLHFKPYQEEINQVAHIHIHEKLLPKLNPELLQGAQNYLYRGIRNYIITYFYVTPSKSNKIKYNMEYNIDNSDSSDNTPIDAELIKEDTRKEIIAKLDEKIMNKKVINGTYCIYLQLLREYLIENNFDERGVKEYIMHKMNIKNSTFNTISSQLGIRVTSFSKKKLAENEEI